MKISAHQPGRTVVPFRAVVLHEESGTSALYATKHEIKTVAGRPQLKEGSLLTVDDLAAMLKALQTSGDAIRWVDSQMLATGYEFMLWYSPPKLRPMFFNSSPHLKHSVKGQALLATPGLVWMVADGQLHVYAVHTKGRPEKSEALYQAPFWNVWSRGAVCVGSAIKPQGAQAGDPDAWEQMFFGSTFTHPNFSQENRLLHGDPVQFWADQLKSPSKSFPLKKLAPIGLTLGDIATSRWKDAVMSIPKAKGEF